MKDSAWAGTKRGYRPGRDCTGCFLSSTINAAAIRLYKRRGWTVDHQGAHPKYTRCNIGMSKRL